MVVKKISGTGNMNVRKTGKPQRLANCHVNVATSPQHLLFKPWYAKGTVADIAVCGLAWDYMHLIGKDEKITVWTG